MYYSLEPEVAGGFGENSVLDTNTHPPDVKHLHYEFDGWLGDDLVESFPCYLVSERLKKVISEVATSGFSFAEVEVSTSEEFHDMCDDQELPEFSWLKVFGQPGVDDFGMSSENCLVVSERVLKGMQEGGNLENCDITEYQPS